MNKKSLLVSLFVLSLTGCKISYVIESEITKSEDDSIVLSEESQTSEASSLTSQNSEEESIEQTSESQESLTPSQSEDKEERIKSITFINNSKMPTNCADFAHTANNEKLISIFNEIEDDFVTSEGILTDKVFSRSYKETVTLQIGSGSASGGLIFNSNYLIKSVKMNCSPYYSSYIDTWTDSENPYTVYSVDNYVQVDINDVTKEIIYEGSEEPEALNLLFEFSSPTSEFSLFTTELSQRLFIYSMEFTYLA